MKTQNFMLSEPVIEKLRAIADKKDISLSELVRRVLDDYVEKVYERIINYDGPKRESL